MTFSSLFRRKRNKSDEKSGLMVFKRIHVTSDKEVYRSLESVVSFYFCRRCPTWVGGSPRRGFVRRDRGGGGGGSRRRGR